MPKQPYVFAQFLGLLPKFEFLRIVNRYQGDYRTMHFKCWDQLASMMFAHIRQEKSLRDIDIAWNAHNKKLYHIGIQQCPKSTLADANNNRNWRIYADFAKSMMTRARKAYQQTELTQCSKNPDLDCHGRLFGSSLTQRALLADIQPVQIITLFGSQPVRANATLLSLSFQPAQQ